MRTLIRPLLLAPLLLAACAFVNPPRDLPPGTPVDAVRARLGEPTGDFALPGGGRRLEYARGPVGKQTWMVDVDAGGRLVAVEQVLTEKRFNQIRAGISQDDVRLALGRPADQSYIGWQHQRVWSYRYESPFCQWFQVGIDEQGKVVDTGYGPDPACFDDEVGFNVFHHHHR